MQPTINNHSIYDRDFDIRLPLRLNGIISYLDCQTPSNDKLSEIRTCIELTPKSKDWNPHDEIYTEQEDAMIGYKGHMKEGKKQEFIVSSILSRTVEPTCFNNNLTHILDRVKMYNRVFAVRTTGKS